MADSRWLQSLKAGDRVAIEYGGLGPRRWNIYSVTRATKTHIEVGGAAFRKYRRKDGSAVSDSYHAGHIEEPTAELLEEMAEQQRRDHAFRVVSELSERRVWREWPTDSLDELGSLLVKLHKINSKDSEAP
jgi:hypothetical protein